MKPNGRSRKPSKGNWDDLIESLRKATDQAARPVKKARDKRGSLDVTSTQDEAARLTMELKERVSTIEGILKARPRHPARPVFRSAGHALRAKQFVIPKELRPVQRTKDPRPRPPSARPIPPEPTAPPERPLVPDEPPDHWTFRAPTFLERTIPAIRKRYESSRASAVEEHTAITAKRRQARVEKAEQEYRESLELHAAAEEQRQSSYSKAIKEYEQRVAELERNLKDWEERCAEEEMRSLEEERIRLEKLAELEKLHRSRQEQERALEAKKRNSKVESLRSAWKKLRSSYFKSPGDAAVYFELAFSLSPLPSFIPRQIQFAYLPESRQLAIERELPLSSAIPDIAEYSFVKRTGELRPKPRPAKDVRILYSKLVAALTLRTIHEAFLADVMGQIDLVALNGFVDTYDRATGRRVKPCLVSVRVSREEFVALDLDNIEEIACLRRLGAQLSPQPDECLAVKPVIDFNMLDKRFVDERDLISGLDTRPNLMDLNPFEFESLVSNLFNKLGLESKLTRTNKDGGVDAVAFDTRPIVGGKVVIQAKRWRHVVGVSAARDLYGTMINEGANKGILVTTSHYGKDTYIFCRDKPIELIDGGGLLHYLDSVGVKASIKFPDVGPGEDVP